MTRYYYDCPIDAAFMAKQHGMTFTDVLGCELTMLSSDSEVVWWQNSSDYDGDKFYLTPESEAMLNDRKGDILIFEDGMMAGTRSVGYRSKSYLDYYKIPTALFRNGHPFIMPKEGKV